MDIVHGSQQFNVDLAAYVAGPMAEQARRLGATLLPLTEVSGGPALPARVNLGRWIVDCPDCHGAEFAWLATPLFMCQSCFNATVGGRWRRVALPVHRGEIEAALTARPLPHTRNWEPGESIAQLLAENELHGVVEGAAQ